MKDIKKTINRFNILWAVIFALSSCTVFKTSSAPPEYAIDLVCGMQVNKSEAYIYQYNDKKYYFDNYNCKQTFKMNPKKFLENKCEDKK